MERPSSTVTRQNILYQMCAKVVALRPRMIPFLLVILTTLYGAQTPTPRRPKRIPTRPIPRIRLAPLSSPASGNIQIDLARNHILNQFKPSLAIGIGVDSIGQGDFQTLFAKPNVQSMLSAGQGSVSYRLYTELNGQDWHWNPNGTWSDAANGQGYFVGSSAVRAQIVHSYGYQLEHRGSTFDQGDNLSYSRIDDGDPTTYWKSNPYLTSTYTHEADVLHPQWVVVDLGSSQSINAIRIKWAAPFAVSYSVQYWTGPDAIYDPTNGKWVTFSNGNVLNGTGGTATLKLSNTPNSAEFVRVVMTQSSNTFDSHGSRDPRNGMGYAIYEIGVGSIDSAINFTDLVVHQKDQNQSLVYASSTDPWHTSTAQDPQNEQVGLDFLLSGTLSQRLPSLVPVPLLYSTPENAVSEVAYLTRRRYPIVGIELGEEPDGQYMTPEDYGALYIQWAKAIHDSYSQYRLGGPTLSNSGVITWPDANGESDWLKRFVAYLLSHSALAELSFVSTEHYPFAATTTDWTLSNQELTQVAGLFAELVNAQVPKTIPVYVTEYNLNSGTTQAAIDLMGAIWHSLFMGEFMNRGGAGSYYYQYLPTQLATDGTIFGILGMLVADTDNDITSFTSQYFSSQLLTQEWCQPGDQTHQVLPATTTIKDSFGNPMVIPYVVRRPDGQYSVLLVNTDSVPHSVQVSFVDSATHYFSGSLAQVQFSAKEYVWIPNGTNGAANPDGPLDRKTVAGGNAAFYTIPEQSLTVLRGKIN